MSDSAGRKVNADAHKFVPSLRGKDQCWFHLGGEQFCGQPESAHRSAPQPLKDRPDWEAIKALGKSVDWPTNMPIVGAAAPDNAEDRLALIAKHIASRGQSAGEYKLGLEIRAVLEEVIRECASEVRFVSETATPGTAILRHWGLKE